MGVQKRKIIKNPDNSVTRISSSGRKFTYKSYQKGGSTQSEPKFVPVQVWDAERGDSVPGMRPVVDKNDTLFVSNPNDPRLKAYEDSSKLYNNYLEVTEALKRQGYISAMPANTEGLSNLPENYFDNKTTQDVIQKNERKYGSIDKRKEGTLNSTSDFISNIINPTLPRQLYSDVIQPESWKFYRYPNLPLLEELFGDKTDPRINDKRMVADYSNVKPTQPVAYREDKSKNNSVLDFYGRKEGEITKSRPATQQDLDTAYKFNNFIAKPGEQYLITSTGSIIPKQTTTPTPTKPASQIPNSVEVPLKYSRSTTGASVPKTDIKRKYYQEGNKYYMDFPDSKSKSGTIKRPITKETYELGLQQQDEDLGFRPRYKWGGKIRKSY